MNLQLPSVVQAYFEISNGDDISRMAACFHADARVIDEKRCHQGIEAIESWQRAARQAFTYRVEPIESSGEGDQLSVTAMVSGDFPGSPLPLRHVFTLREGQISSLEIAP
ncbi:nuclear transport factor 2 family protein [Pseudomonas sediminis]|uniref:Nuclear transport factor 2 family protein n=1 Tax=Pseudomonas sediminis TaxID=1691904 RepID=A0ABX6SGZ4_9PSED|nr:nuclear transport factor 2 family protein [Pseudomonas sediminis]QNH00732.1 nuclear transport factor 2 family protein [Pseudomonas sediminis]